MNSATPTAVQSPLLDIQACTAPATTGKPALVAMSNTPVSPAQPPSADAAQFSGASVANPTLIYVWPKSRREFDLIDLPGCEHDWKLCHTTTLLRSDGQEWQRRCISKTLGDIGRATPTVVFQWFDERPAEPQPPPPAQYAIPPNFAQEFSLPSGDADPGDEQAADLPGPSRESASLLLIHA